MQPLVTVDLARVASALPEGVNHEQVYRELTALLTESVGAESAGLFAEPRLTKDNIDFLVPEGRIARFDELDPTGRDRLRAEIGRIVSELRRAAELKADRDPRRYGGLPALARAAIEIPSFEYVFAHEGRPVLTAWAMVPPGVPGGLGLLRALDDGVPRVAKQRLSVSSLAIAGLSLLAVAAVGFLLAPWLRGLLEPPSPVCQVVPVERDALIGLDDERRRERELRSALAALQQELGNRRASCPIPVLPPPVPRPVPLPVPPPEPPRASVEPKPVEPPVTKPEPVPQPPPVQRPPDAQPCNAETRSGGAGRTETRHFLGSHPGRVTLTYNAFREPDRIVVYYRGQPLAQTSGYEAGVGRISFDWNPPPGGAPNSYVVTVEVTGTPGSRSTVWVYNLGCPANR
jgi:hypothetical protein